MIKKGILRSKKFDVGQLKIWYGIAKKDGFEDIELFDLNSMEPRLHLSARSTVPTESLFGDTEQSGVVIDPTGKIQYYEAACDLNHILLEDGYHVFSSYEDQQVWEMYTQGISQEVIAKKVSRTQQAISKKILKYSPLLTNKATLPSAQKMNTGCDYYISEDSEYEVVDYCKDPLKTTEDVLVSKIDRDRAGIRTRDTGYYEDIEEDLRNRFTEFKLAEGLLKLDELRRRDNSGGVNRAKAG